MVMNRHKTQFGQ